MGGLVLFCLFLACICGFCALAQTPWSALFHHVLPVPLCCLSPSRHRQQLTYVDGSFIFFFKNKFDGLFCVVCVVSLYLILLTCVIHL
jgi:hypothetical protein